MGLTKNGSQDRHRRQRPAQRRGLAPIPLDYPDPGIYRFRE